MSDFFSGITQIMMPFVAAFIFAYILEPLTKRLIALKIPRSLAALVTLLIGVCAAVTIVLLLLNLMNRELPLIKAQFPDWITSVQSTIDPFLAKFDLELDWASIKEQAQATITSKISDNANAIFTKSLGTILKSSGSILGFFANTALVLFVLFYLLLEWDTFLGMISELIPHRFRETFFKLVGEVDILLSQYLRGQILLMLSLAIFYSIGLYMIGLASAVPLGVFTGLVSFIPYVGIAISVSLTLMSALLQFGPGNAILAVAVLYGAGQMIEQFFLTPRLVGESIGLHPVAVIFAIMVFGHFLGFFGILLAFPMSAICLVAIRHLRANYFSSEWFKSKS
jgi:predicted PurR-regulated permease PerM